MAKADLHVMIDEEVLAQVKQIADGAGISMGGVVNMALKRCLPALWDTMLNFTPPPAPRRDDPL